MSNPSQEGVATKGSDSDKQSSQKDMHIDLQWNDSHANYYCKVSGSTLRCYFDFSC